MAWCKGTLKIAERIQYSSLENKTRKTEARNNHAGEPDPDPDPDPDPNPDGRQLPVECLEVGLAGELRGLT